MAYSDTDRLLTARATITYPDTATQAITSTHISSFIVNEDAGADVPVGAAPAASFELKLDNSSGQWEPGGSILGAHILDGAKIEIEIGLWNGAAYDYSDIGTYYVDDVQGQEHETLIRLKGTDAMVSLMSEYYADATGDYPQTLGALLTDIATTAGVTLESAVFTNSTVSIPLQPVWRNNLTCREAVGYIAACAGGIAIFNRAGKLEIVTLEAVSSRAIGTSVYKTFTRGDTFFGALNAINVYAYGAPDGTSPSRYATTPATPDTSLNSINIRDNPILAYGSTALPALGAGMLAALTGLYFRGGSIKWHGDPSTGLGELCTVTDLAATAVPVLITKQSITFGPGFGMTSGCDVTTSTKADASNKLQKIFTPTGNLNAEALAGNIYVKAGEKMTLESGSNLNLLSGGAINIKNLSDTDNVINMDNTGLTLSSTGQLKLESTDSIIIGGSPFGVGGTNLLTGTDYETSYTAWTPNTANTTQSLDTSTAVFGTKSLLISRPASDGYGGVYRYVSLLANTTYTFSVWAYVYAGSWYINSTGHANQPMSGGWQRYSYTITTTTAGTYIIMILAVNSDEVAHIFIDRPKLEMGPIATDWSPSPQDTVDALDALDGRLGDVETRVQIFYQASKPTYTAVGDLWYDTDSNPLEVWKCTNVSTQAHTAFTDPVLTRALSAASAASDAAAAAQGTANSKINTFVGSSTPTALAAGDLWMDTGNKNIWKRATAAGTGGWVQYLTAAGYLITTGITIDGTDLTVKATGNLNLAADGNLNVQNGGNLNVLNGGDIEISNGGDINVASGGKINVSATDLMISGKTVETYASDKIRLEVSVGGTNLIPGSDFENGWPGWYANGAVAMGDGSGDVVHIGKNMLCYAANAGGYQGVYYTYTKFEPNTPYTLSFWMYALNAVNVSSSIASETLAVPDSTWTKRVLTFTPTQASGHLYFLFASGTATGQAFYLDTVKLEKGTTATDWSPAPSDPASGVKTSYIDIATDHIDIATGGTLTLNAADDIKIGSGGGTLASTIDLSANNSIKLAVTSQSANLFPSDPSSWEQGVILSADGSNSASTTRIRSTDYITLNAGTLYTVSRVKSLTGQVSLHYYNNSAAYIGNSGGWVTTYPYSFSLPSGATKMRVAVRTAADSTLVPTGVPGILFSIVPAGVSGGVKTSSVEVNANGIYMDTTGDFNVNAGVNLSIKGGSGANSIGISNNPADTYFMWAGNASAASAPFSVKRDGSVKATSGTIGGFTIASGSLSAQASGKPLLKLDTANSTFQLANMTLLYNSDPSYPPYQFIVDDAGELLFGTPELIVADAFDFFTASAAGVWVYNNVSALSFTDRTPFYDGDAVKELKKIKGNGKGIDHDTLPEFARASIKRTKRNKVGTKEEIVEDGRDLGAMISILTKAVQELDGRLEKIEDRIK